MPSTVERPPRKRQKNVEAQRSLGPLQELLLLATQGLGKDAYAARINGVIKHATGRLLNVSSLYHTLSALENDGHLRSSQEHENPDGGMPRRFYKVTAKGSQALRAAEMARRIARGTHTRPAGKGGFSDE